MTPTEIDNALKALSKLDIAQLDMGDQIIYLAALTEFAEKIKPIVLKYSDRLPNGSTFLLKI